MTNKIQIGLRVTEETAEKLRIQADIEKRSVNNLIEYIINNYLKQCEMGDPRQAVESPINSN